jgi:hypothetical protein
MRLNRYLKAKLWLLIPLIVISSCDKDVEDLDYNEYDLNSDGEVTQSEFIQAMDEVDFFQDINDDNIYSEDDIYIGYYNLWDLDDDGYLSEEEWDKGSALYFDNQDISPYGPYEGWDMDNDLKLDENEFSEGMTQEDYLHEWNIDEDSGISEKEFYRMVFDYWDQNNDGIFSRSEYEEIYNAG